MSVKDIAKELHIELMVGCSYTKEYAKAISEANPMFWKVVE